MLSAGATSYTYDQNGNELTAGSSTFAYDLANRLKTAIQGATTTTYSYDGDSKRLQASTGTLNSQKTNFLWDVTHSLPQLAQERNGANNLQRQYIYGLRRIRQSQGTGTYYLYDGLGSVTTTLAPLGALQKTLSYEPFGQIRTTSGSSPTNFFHFTGEYLDPTGLYHLRARQYDPAVGRFLRSDPIEPDSDSPFIAGYIYAANRPGVLIDPSGLTVVLSDRGQDAASVPTSFEEYEAPSSRLTPKMRTNARIIFTLARRAGLSRQRAREMVAAAFKESSLDPAATNQNTGAAGLFQLLGPFANRASKLGGAFKPRVNTCAILPNFRGYWTTHPKAPPGQCASMVEASGKSASFYSGPLAWLPTSFKLIAIKPCPALKPICAGYFAGTRFAFPNCSMDG